MESDTTTTLMEATATATLRCGLAAWATLSGDASAIAAWRRQAMAAGADAKPASFLKHAEDQTVLAVRSVHDAIDRAGWQTRSFADWGVIAGGSFFGRTVTAYSMHRFREEGPWCVSPHLIPNQSLHAPPGAISLALKSHGPNFGVGSGANAAPDALLLAAALLADGALPGLWVVLTAHDTEWVPGADGSNANAPVCRAVALALTPAEAPPCDSHISFGQRSADLALKAAWEILPEFHVAGCVQEIGVRAARWRLGDSHWVVVDAQPHDREDAP